MTYFENQRKHEDAYMYEYNDRARYMHLTSEELADVVKRLQQGGMKLDRAIELVSEVYLISKSDLAAILNLK